MTAGTNRHLHPHHISALCGKRSILSLLWLGAGLRVRPLKSAPKTGVKEREEKYHGWNTAGGTKQEPEFCTMLIMMQADTRGLRPLCPGGLQQGQKERQGETLSVKGVEISYWVSLLGQNPPRWNPEEKNKHGKGSDEQLHLLKSF